MIGRVVLIGAVVSSGCGRLFFDPLDGSGDAPQQCTDPIGHDEDGDGIDDSCDVCPQLDDDQRDTDNDRVGDACDLAPTTEQRLLFDPFTTMRSEWMFDSSIELNADSINLPAVGDTSVINLAGVPGRTVLEMGGRVTAVGTTGPQIAIHIGEDVGPTNYYCEVYYSNALRLKLTHYLAQYSTLAETLIPGTPVAGASWRLVFEHVPPNLRCVVWWNGVRYEAAALDPGDIPQEEMYVAANDIDLEVEYFSRLTSP